MKLIYGSLLALVTAILFYRLFYIPEQINTNLSEYLISKKVPDKFYSSIWCEFCNENQKCCEIENLIFYPQEKTFIFVLNDDSVIHGIENAEEFNKISTSSVLNHTELFLPLVIMSNMDEKLKQVGLQVDKTVFLLHRFKPDNVMHVLHDDLLPLFSRYEAACRGDVSLCIETNLLAFIDPLASTGRTGDYEEWYNIFSSHAVINLYDEKDAVILRKALTGLPGTTIGFQYGFGRPQGPVSLQEQAVPIFKRFTRFVRNKFDIKLNSDQSSKEALLISRKQTRKILNENQVIEYIENSYKTSQCSPSSLRILTLDLHAVRNVPDILTLICNADLIVAMHGASTYLTALFSKHNATIIELFPYGIQPQFVSPILSMSQLPSVWFSYATWENLEAAASVEPDSDAAILLGGLSHLSDEERQIAKETLPVPAVPCCHHPAYLHRIFQNTVVGPGFEATVKNALLSSQRKSHHSWTQDFYIPGPVLDANCTFIEDSGMSRVTWTSPINLSSFSNVSLTYDIIASSISGSQLQETQVTLLVEFNDILISAWVKACVTPDVCGKDVFVTCK